MGLLLVTSLVAGTTALACSSSSAPTPLPAGIPADAKAFTIPSSDWNLGTTCSGKEYAVYGVPSCATPAYILCYSGTWSYEVCASSPPAGFTETPEELSDAGDDASGYPDCASSTCPSCGDLQDCCASGVDIPNAGVCDHTDWDESVCESLLNKYPACGETCSNGKCTSSGNDAG